VDERDFAELISVFLQENKDEKKQAKTVQRKAATGRETKATSTVKRTMIEALAEQADKKQKYEKKEESATEIKEKIEAKQAPVLSDEKEATVTVTPPKAKERMEKKGGKAVDKLKEILKDFVAIDGIIAAIVATEDGFLVEGEVETKLDTETISAAISSLNGALQLVGEEMGQGNLESALVEFETGSISIAPVGKEAILALVADKSATIGRVRLVLRRKVDIISKAI
jgi:hypothetical protein